MPLHQVKHDSFEVCIGDLFVAVFVKFFHGFIDIRARYIFIAFLFLEKSLHFIVANVPVSIFIIEIKCLLYIIVIYEHIEIDATHKELVKVQLVVSIDVGAFQWVKQSFTIFDFV